MFEILKNQILSYSNVLIYRNKMTQQESAFLTNNINAALAESGATQSGPTITVTHSIEILAGAPIIDLEIFIPLNKEIIPPENFSFATEFKIENALKIRICGNPQNMNSAIEKLKEYIDSNKLTPTTPIYTVTVQGATNQEELENMIIDIYVGIK